MTARILAAAALCLNRSSSEDEACGACTSCRELAKGVNADLIEPMIVETHGNTEELRALEDSDREITLTKTIAPLLQLAGLRSVHGSMRVIIIPRAERMNDICQNALLKSLEEPTGQRLWILTAEDPSRLLSTVRSRLVPVRFGRLPAKAIAELLSAEGIASDEALQLASVAEGSIVRARELASGKWNRELDILEETVVPRIGTGPAAGPFIARALLERLESLLERAPDEAPSQKSAPDAESRPSGDERESRRRAAILLLEMLVLTLRKRLLRHMQTGSVPEELTKGIEVALAHAHVIGQNVRVELALSAAAAALAG